MKQIFAALALTLISASSFAGTPREYDFMAVGLLNQVHECAAELSQAMAGGKFVLSALEMETQQPDATVDTLEVSIGTRARMPSSFHKVETRLLIVKKALYSKQIHAPDAPTIWEKTDCTLIAVP